MLQINPSGYLDFDSQLEQIRFRQWLLENSHAISDNADDILGIIKEILESLRLLASDLDLPVTKEILQEDLVNIPNTYNELTLIIRTIKAELRSKLFLYIPSHAAKYYEYGDILSDAGKTAFPLAYAELKLSGNCFAMSLHTACVFHSMRAAEIGVRALGRDLKVSFSSSIDHAGWHSILDQIDLKIRDMKNLSKGQGKKEDLEFYSTSASQFRYFKDAWRNQVAHARADFTEDESIKVLDHTRDFFEALSKRLIET